MPADRKSRRGATLRAYQADWSDYEAWCQKHRRSPIPAELATLTAYLESLANSRACATIHRRLSAIGNMHRLHGVSWNGRQRQIRDWLQRQRPELGRPARQLHRFTNAILRELLAACDDTAIGRRDRAILLIGFTGALRPAELAAMQVEDVDIGPHGLAIFVRNGRTDSGAASSLITLFRANDPLICPWLALQRWRANIQRKTGPLFVSIAAREPDDATALAVDDIQDIIHARGRLLGLQFKRLDRLSATGLRFSHIASPETVSTA